MASQPVWLTKMANQAIEQIRVIDLLAPIGCHTFFDPETEQWEVTLFAANTEIIGGQFDGKLAPSRFAVDLNGLLGLFSDVTSFQWQTNSVGPEDDLGPHIAIEAKYEGHAVWFRLLANAPSQFECGRNALMDEMRLEDLW